MSEESRGIDALPPKLRQKEFKSTQKDLRSKELSIRSLAWTKLYQPAYLIEGGCFPVFLQTLNPKPKQPENTSQCVMFLANLLDSMRNIEAINHPALLGLYILVDQQAESIGMLDGWIECLLFHEPEKKKKKKNGSNEEPQAAENLNFVQTRVQSLRALFLLFLPLSSLANDNVLRLSMANYNPLLHGIMRELEQNLKTFCDGSMLDLSILQSCLYSFYILIWILQVNPSAIDSLIENSIMSYLDVLSLHPLLCPIVCNILFLATKTESGLNFLSGQNMMTLIVGLLERGQHRYVEIITPKEMEIPQGKAKDPKKDKKLDKIPMDVDKPVDPFETIDYLRLDEHRGHLVCVQFLVKTLGLVVEQRKHCFTSDIVGRVADVGKELLPKHELWRECALMKAPFDELLTSLTLHFVRLLGQLGEVCLDFCAILRQKNVSSLVCSLLLQCEQVIPVQQDESKILVLRDLQRLTEKTLLVLMADSTDAFNEESRFFTASQYICGPDVGIEFGQFFQDISQILDSNNINIVVRGIRVFSAFCFAVRDNEVFVGTLNTRLVDQISKLCVQFATKQLEIETAAPDLFFIDVTNSEALCLSLLIIDRILPLNADFVNIFFESKRIEHLVSCLNCGPVDGSLLLEETEVFLHDPRWFSWYFNVLETHPPQRLLLRPLIMDTLRHVVLSDSCYRIFESGFEGEQWKILPPSSCVCEEASFTTIKIAVESVFRILLVCVEWCIEENRLKLRSVRNEHLFDQVRQSALLFLEAVGRCGVLAVDGILAEIGMRMLSNGSESCINGLIKLFGQDRSTLTNTSVAGRHQFFSDCGFSSTGSILSIDYCSAYPLIWPHILLLGSLLGVLFEKASTHNSLALAVRALSSLTRFPQFLDSAQPVVADILCAVVLSLGGAVNLAALAGTLGENDTDHKNNCESLLMYWISRGYNRESYWLEFEKQHRADMPIDGKLPKKKEDDKKSATKDKKDKNIPVVAPVFPIITLNHESSPDHADPNRGPSVDLWSALLNEQHYCAHLMSCASTVLICGVQSGIGNLLMETWIDDQKVDINVSDKKGCSALMYALLLGDERSVDCLLCRHVNLDWVDNRGFPAIMYALRTLSREDTMIVRNAISTANFQSEGFVGSTVFLYKMIERGVDINVCDQMGNSPLLFALGSGSLTTSVCGHTIVVRSAELASTKDGKNLRLDVLLLLEHGSRVNHCSRSGLVALHLVSSMGDMFLFDSLLRFGADPNSLDTKGYHALHHLLACCPQNTLEVLKKLLDAAQNRPATQTSFLDGRTNTSVELKLQDELSVHFESSIAEAFTPLSLFAPRMQLKDLLLLESKENITPIFACTIGREMLQPISGSLSFDEKHRRIETLLFLFDIAEKEGIACEIVQHRSQGNLSLLHAVSLLLTGETDKLELTDKQKRSRRIRYFDSNESALMEKVRQYLPSGELDLNDYISTFFIPSLNPFESCWTPFHAAIRNGNRDQLSRLIDLFGHDGFIATQPAMLMSRFQCMEINFQMASKVLLLCLSEDGNNIVEEIDAHDRYNVFTAAIHSAIACHQYNVLRTMFSCPKVDVNNLSTTTRLTPAQSAITLGNIKALFAMENGMERMDLCLSLFDCYTLQRSFLDLILLLPERVDILIFLARWRRNDIVQLLVADQDMNGNIFNRLQRGKQDLVSSGLNTTELDSLIDFFHFLVDGITIN